MSASWRDDLSELRVSSVLSRNVREFGKKHLIDDRVETCWNSDQGSPQWIQLRFRKPVCLTSLILQFQGGFAGRSCRIDCSQTSRTDDLSDSDNQLVTIPFHPEDINKEQTFTVFSDNDSANYFEVYKIIFDDSTDFYGRITIYKLDLQIN